MPREVGKERPMAVDLKQAHRRVIEEVFGKGNYGVLDEACEPGYRAHDPLTGDADLRQEKENARMYRTAFPDLRASIVGSWADGETVVTQWRMAGTHESELMGMDATGKRCTVEGISIARFRGAKMVESWTQWDALGLMRQIGVAPELLGRGEVRSRESRIQT
jgi:predicted ester cyclase